MPSRRALGRSYHDDVRAAAKGFLSIGSVRYDGVAILGFNAPEWFMAEVAAMYFGGKAAGVCCVIRDMLQQLLSPT